MNLIKKYSIKEISENNLISFILFIFPIFIFLIRSWATGLYLVVFLLAIIRIKYHFTNLKDLDISTKKIAILICLIFLSVLISNFANPYNDSIPIKTFRITVFEVEIKHFLFLFILLYLYYFPKSYIFFYRGIFFTGLMPVVWFCYSWYSYGINYLIFKPKVFIYSQVFFGRYAALLFFLLLITKPLAKITFKGSNVIFTFSLFILLISVAVSGSRSAWLTFIILALLFLIYFKKEYFLYIKNINTKLLLVFVVLFTAFIWNIKSYLFDRGYEVYEEIILFQDNKITASHVKYDRLLKIQAALKVMYYKPLLGFGTGGTTEAIELAISEGSASPLIRKDGAKENFLNDFLNILVSYGFIGVILKFGLIFYFLFWFFKNRKINNNISFSGIILIISILVFGITDSVITRSIYISIFYIFLAVLYNHLLHIKNKQLIKKE